MDLKKNMSTLSPTSHNLQQTCYVTECLMKDFAGSPVANEAGLS